jgi:GNAT superfamily N-acetyltransferase
MCERVNIIEGCAEDYEALARFHYRAGRPATMERVLVAVEDGERAGVLVVSRPVLNARWRGLLWPGEFEAGGPRERAMRVNEHLRCISRVVVEPRFRGLGVGRGLVAAYLARPITARTEAVAAMGAVCGLFRAAGMREVVVPASGRDAALRRALRRAGIAPWRLVDPASARRLGRSERAAVESALRRWANDAGATRSVAHAGLAELMACAARTVASPLRVRAYGFDAIRG